MGGRGSGNRSHAHRPPKKRVAEECVALCADRMARLGDIRAGEAIRAERGWIRLGGPRLLLRLDADGLDPRCASLRLSWHWERLGGPFGKGECLVRLSATEPHFGGLRWWLHCPFRASPATEPCGKRAGKLFLLPEGTRLGCRDCHGLSYRSRQEGHLRKRVSRLAAQDGGWTFHDAIDALRALARSSAGFVSC